MIELPCVCECNAEVECWLAQGNGGIVLSIISRVYTPLVRYRWRIKPLNSNLTVLGPCTLGSELSSFLLEGGKVLGDRLFLILDLKYWTNLLGQYIMY